MTDRRRTDLEIRAAELWLWVSAIGRYLLVMFCVAVFIGWVTDVQSVVVRSIASIPAMILFLLGFGWATKGEREEKVTAFLLALALIGVGLMAWYEGGVKELVERLLR